MVLNVGVSFFDWNLLRNDFTWRGPDNYTSTLLNIDFQSAAANTAIYLARFWCRRRSCFRWPWPF